MDDFHRILNLVKLGTITLVDDSGVAQTLQLKLPSVGPDGSPLAEYPRLAEFGFSSSPPMETEVVLVSMAGNRTHGMVIATNHQASRPTGLSPGDAMLYSARDGRAGQKVWLADGQLIVDGGGGPVVVQNASQTTIDGPVVINGPLTVNGTVEATGDVVAASASSPVSLENLLT